MAAVRGWSQSAGSLGTCVRLSRRRWRVWPGERERVVVMLRLDDCGGWLVRGVA